MFAYFPEKGEESPLFAHIIAIQQIKAGYRIPEVVVEAVVFSAKRGKRDLRVGLNRWNNTGFLKFKRVNADNLKSPANNISYTFGKSEKVGWGKRTKLMLDALKFEASIFSSISVN